MTSYLQGEFTLLGHHLKLLTDLVPPIGKTPEEVAQTWRKTFVKVRGDITAETVDWQVLAAPRGTPGRLATYAYTLVGETPEQADRYENTLRDELTAFASLDEEARVLLTAKGVDGICKSCTFMNHCLIPDEKGVDAQYLDLFEDMLAFARKKKPSFYESAIRTPERNLLTSAKAVRQVMTYFAMGGLASKAHFYSDALSRQKRHGSMFAGPDKSAVEEHYNLHKGGGT